MKEAKLVQRSGPGAEGRSLGAERSGSRRGKVEKTNGAKTMEKSWFL